MTIQQNQDMWQEYADCMNSGQERQPTSEEMAETLVKERHERLINTTRHLNSDLENYELKVADIAEQECKTPAQWRNEEAEGIRINTLGAMTHRSAGELLERYQLKIQMAYKNENRIQTEINRYQAIIQENEKTIEELSKTGFKNRLRSAKNKLEHAKGFIVILECELAKQNIKTQRYSDKVMKWTGINKKLKLAYIKQEIRDEKSGIGNKYGYNPKAQSRETAEIMFQD